MSEESDSTPEDAETTGGEVPENTENNISESGRTNSITQRWWWSNTLQTVIGAVVALLQLDFITGDGGVWLNWVVFILGGVLFVTGIIGLIRAYLRQRTKEIE